MPKTKIDYSNTIMYKIFCKDSTVKDLYVGHTTNFIQRKSLHKSACENHNSSSKLYKIIRENGGWDNWEMSEITVLNLKNSTEAKIKENEYYEKLKSDLNQIITPSDATNLFMCEKYINEKNNNLLFCANCDYKCDTEWLWERHIKTQKHKNIDKSYEEKVKKNICNCGKEYATRQSLFNHKKKCSYNVQPTGANDTLNEKEVIMTLLNQNNQLQNQIIEMCKERNNTTINNTIGNINSHNKTFNLNVFLNETCKDAMNITDFVDSLKLQLADLEAVGKLGYVEGISNIIVKNLKALEVHKRPVHCSDSKREVMYIKDEDKWEKENEEKNKLRKVIKKIANKNSRLLPKFKEKHPDCGKSESKFSDQYNKLIVEAMGGPGDNDCEKEDKIIRKIANEVTIDKNMDID
jgi:hypothetical protein